MRADISETEQRKTVEVLESMGQIGNTQPGSPRGKKDTNHQPQE